MHIIYRIDTDDLKKVYPITYKEAILYLEGQERLEDVI